MKQRLHKHHGFSLIEVVIALSIIGLLLTMTLQGQSLLMEADVKNTIALSQDLSRAIHDFKERYHYLPGDLPRANEDISGISERSSCANPGNGNGRIDEQESRCVPEHLYRAGYISGAKISESEDGTKTISIPYRGIKGSVQIVARSDSDVANSDYPQNIQHIIEFRHVPLEVAKGIDRKLDDGDLASGNVQASSGVSPVGGNTISQEDTGDLVQWLVTPL